MAINPESQYPGKIAPSSPSYPYGQARNITIPGDGTGTPWEAAFVNDLFGWQQAILAEVGLVPSGSPETVLSSQYLSALNLSKGRVVADYAEMQALNVTKILNGTSILVKSTGRQGFFVWDSSNLTSEVTGDPEQGLYVAPSSDLTGASGAYVRAVKSTEAISVFWYGAVGDNVADDRPAIQAAEDYARPLRKKVWFPTPEVGYRVNAPLVINTFSSWEGETEQIYIYKHGNTTSGLPTRLIPAGGGASDTMNVDAVLVVDHADNAYASYVHVKNLYFRNEPSNSTTVAFNIYSPRMNYFSFESVSCRGAGTACWRWFDAWQGQIDRMFVADGAAGFNAEEDGLASGSGTSLTFIRPYALNCGVGYDIYGLAYSSFINPACDEPSSIGYRFLTCNEITVLSLGIETVTTATYSVICVQSGVNILGVKENNNNPTITKLGVTNGSRVTASNIVFLDYAAPSGQFNLELSGTSHLITNNCRFPTNGNSFISYGAGSTWTENLDGELSITNSTDSASLKPDSILPAFRAFNQSITSSPGTPGAIATGLGRQPENVRVTISASTVDTLPAVIPVCSLASNGGSLFIRFLNFSGAEVTSTQNVDIIAY